VHCRQRKPNALDSLVPSKQMRFESTCETVCRPTDRWVPDEIREREFQTLGPAIEKSPTAANVDRMWNQTTAPCTKH